jgi:hypothetical protein
MSLLRQTRWAITLGILLSFEAPGEEIGEFQVKAVFLCNFAKFVEWPPQTFKTPDDPIAVCVLGRNPFGKMLEAAASRSEAQGRKFQVREVSEVPSGSNCQILFVVTTDRKQIRSLVESIKDTGILTVGQAQGFTSDGGVINFKLVDNQVRFDINPDAAKRENLRISSRLLNLAEIKK